ncbi:MULTISPECIES: Tn3 family transposase [Saccharothrix]|uniref:Tn3 family transposase n=1 Tax=Saccharothrix TaxID=2071 RepID=UPI00237956DD|nr:Tn3 family transposase [Saccharothrix sp. CB00851]
MTLVNFGLFDLLGLQLSPRIRDLGKVTLYRAGPGRGRAGGRRWRRRSRAPGRC